MTGEEVSCSQCGARLLIPVEVVFSRLECPCCRAKLVAPGAARKQDRRVLNWANIFAIGLLGLSLALLFLGCLTAGDSRFDSLRGLFVVGVLVFGGLILLASANETLLRLLPQPWARIATVGLTLLLLLSWLVLLLSSCAGISPFG